jgi:tetratricopeptide (TPR) repeat protein
MREWGKALDYINMALNIKPSSGIYRRKADLLLRLSKSDEAHQCYEIAIALDSKNPYAYLGRGKFFLKNRIFDKAIQDFNTSLSLPDKRNLLPDGVFDIEEAHLRLWETYILAGDQRKSEEQARILFGMISKKSQLREIAFFCRKYKLFEKLLDVSLNLADLDNEKPYEAYSISGYALNLLGRYDEAINYFTESEPGEKKSVLYEINVGLAHWGVGNYTKAKDAFEQANLDMHERPTLANFKPSQNVQQPYEAERVWVMLVLGNHRSALRAAKSSTWKKNISQNDIYNVRDWNTILERVAQEQPNGFKDFSEYIDRVLVEFGDKNIYDFEDAD